MLFIIAYAISLLVSFVLLMIGSALHLRYYSQIGRGKYWAIVCVPMISFFWSARSDAGGLHFWQL